MPNLEASCIAGTSKLLRWGTIHGHFKVADTIAVDEYYTRAEWEAFVAGVRAGEFDFFN